MHTYALRADAMLKIKRMPLTGDREAMAKLRLKRWKARAWMRENNITDLGKTAYLPHNIS
jgi:hypothetical protein